MSNSMSSRPEARPVHWSLLDDAQVTAIHGVLRALAEVVQRLEPRQGPLRPEDPVRWLSRDRSSQIVFISGARGTGETTVLTSLIGASTAPSQTDLGMASLESGRLQEPDARLREAIGWLKLAQGRLVWLEPLDMEPSPNSLHLLLAILARIDAATSRSGARGGALTGGGERERDYWAVLESSPDHQEALLELQRLQTNIAVAWESNLGARAPHLDPDSYAVEVMRAESARLSLNRNLEIVLDKLANSAFRGSDIRNPLFVLPIDDLDLNPAACLQLLNLLRMVSVPRLFTVVLGDLDVAEMVVNLKMSSDLAAVGQIAAGVELLCIPREAITAMAGDLAANVVRKLIPPGQRIQLQPLTALEALNFRPLGSGDNAPRLHGLLANCQVLLEHTPTWLLPSPSTGAPDPTLRDFLLVPSFPIIRARTDVLTKSATEQLGREDIERRPYTALSHLRTTPRRIADLWLSLPQEGETSVPAPGGRPVNALDLAAESARMALSEERAFYPAERRAVLAAIQRHPGEGWTLEPLPVRALPQLHPEQSVSLRPEGMPADANMRIRVRRSRGWRFALVDSETARHGEDRRPESKAKEPVWHRFMAEDTASALVLFHDLLALCPGSVGFVSPLLHKNDEEWLWAMTEWRRVSEEPRWGEKPITTAELRWPFPPCASFWEWDLFLQAWNDGIAGMSPTEGLTVSSLPRLAALWIAVGSAMVMGSTPDVPDWPNVDQNQVWTEPRMAQLVSLARKRDLRSHLASEWLIDLAFFLMPESGIQWGDLLPQFSDSLLSFWNNEQRLEVILQRRALRLFQMYEGIVNHQMRPISTALAEMPLPRMFGVESQRRARRPGQARSRETGSTP